jgi:hypothetical protein
MPAIIMVWVVAVLAAGSTATAIAPQLINYQGELTDSDGIPLSGDYPMTFAIYNDPDLSGPENLKWQETHASVEVTNGLFTVVLGSVTQLNESFFSDTLRYLGITVDDDPEITPRSRITATAFAFHSVKTDTALYAASIADNAVTSTSIQDGAVAFADIGQNGASDHQVMKWNGAAWAPAEDEGGGGGWNWSDSSSHGPDSVLFADSSNHADSSGYADSSTYADSTEAITDGAVDLADIGQNGATDGQIIKWSAPTSAWVPGPDETGGIVWNWSDSSSHGPDSVLFADSSDYADSSEYADSSGYADSSSYAGVSGYSDSTGAITDGAVDFADIGQNGATADQVMKWSGSAWVPTADDAGGGWADDGNVVRLETEADSVGIGTVSPTEKLDVTGNIHASGTITSGSSITIDGATDMITATSGTIDFSDENIVTTGKATIGPGHTNTGANAFVAGASNQVTEATAVVSGGTGNEASGGSSTVSGGALNVASALQATVSGGLNNKASGSKATVGGGEGNVADLPDATVAGGSFNSASGIAASVGGGENNFASGVTSTISGGSGDTASGDHAVVGGGESNYASGAHSIVGGGSGNIAGIDAYTTVAGGSNNLASSLGSTVSGGKSNVASGIYGTVSGGRVNVASGDSATVAGGAHNLAEDYGSTVGGGAFNMARGQYSVVSGGGGSSDVDSNSAHGNHSTIGGGKKNTASTGATVGGGVDNHAIGERSTVAGGLTCYARANYSTVGGGLFSEATGVYSTCSGGNNNFASGNGSTCSGGDHNTASGDSSVVGGGYGNFASGTGSTVAGGVSNHATAAFATVSGGHLNEVYDVAATIAGGESNVAVSFGDAVGGGQENSASGMLAAVGGGYNNTASGRFAAVAGGYNNTATDSGATVGGGRGNDATARDATVCGGLNNEAGHSAVVCGGIGNDATGAQSFIGGGGGNEATISFATISGGWQDTASGVYSTIPGGRQNKASGDGSFAAGRRAKAVHDGAFVWGDYTNADFSSSYVNQFAVRASGGVEFLCSDPVTDVFQVYTANWNEQYRVANFHAAATMVASADVLQLKVGASSPDDFQFIECERGTDVEFRVWGDGDVTADGTFTPGGADFAELVEVASGYTSVEPGDVLVINPNRPNTVVKSSESHSALVAGVYSTKPGVLASNHDWDQVSLEATAAMNRLDAEDIEAKAYPIAELAATLDEVPLAVVGIVPCKVSAENGPIRPGDLLVTSSTPGHAMRDGNPKAGTILGKALESLSSGTGIVQTLVTLQ